MKQEAMSVTALNQYIKCLMERDDVLSAIRVRGELSNYKVYPSGHHYFSLKDAESSLRCVMFRASADKLRFQPTHGMAVTVFGRISVFPRDGQYQLYASHMMPDGAGDLNVAFEQLKKKLEEEGLFDPAHKKPLPKFPRRVALITSGAGAAVRDMIRILGERMPSAQVTVLPVAVQGERAPSELVGALQYANKWQVADVIITGRGGGSLEDLWAFNNEQVARAIFASSIPVISAVGHEPDITIADYVADFRAATPSNGAELAVADWRETAAALKHYQQHLEQQSASLLEHHWQQLDAVTSQLPKHIAARLAWERQRLNQAASNRHMKNPMAYSEDRMKLLDVQQRALEQQGSLTGQRFAQRLSHGAKLLDSLSPLKVLSRGYSVARNSAGTAIRTVEQVKQGDQITLTVEDGEIKALVERTKQHGKAGKKADL